MLSAILSRTLNALRDRRALTALRGRRGAVALEFAFVATPFIFMLFAIIESGLAFAANINLSNATMALARQIRTGKVMLTGGSAGSAGVVLSLADFKTAICAKIVIVPTATCTAQLQVDVRTQSAFGSGQNLLSPLINGVFDNAGLCLYSGSAGSIVEFRAFYLWPIQTPLVFNALVNATSYTVGGQTTTGNYRVLVSTEAFKIEQNGAGANTGSGC